MAKPKYDIGEQVLIKGTVESYRGDEKDIVYAIAVSRGEDRSTACFEFNEKAIFAGFVEGCAEEDDLK